MAGQGSQIWYCRSLQMDPQLGSRRLLELQRAFVDSRQRKRRELDEGSFRCWPPPACRPFFPDLDALLIAIAEHKVRADVIVDQLIASVDDRSVVVSPRRSPTDNVADSSTSLAG